MSLKVGDIMLCTVKKIEPALVLVEIEGNGEGAIVMSEIAAGRIRNLREHVAQNKKIVCKILSINENRVQLSLRRVTSGEREEALNKYQKEKTFTAMLKAITKNSEEIIKNIKKEYDIGEFYEEIKNNSKILDKFFSKKEAEQISKILTEKENTIKQVKKTFIVRTLSDSGLEEIKSLLSTKEADIRYLGSSQFSIVVTAKDFKEANIKIQNILHEIEAKAKAKKILFEIKE